VRCHSSANLLICRLIPSERERMFLFMHEAVKRDPRGQGERGEMIAALWFAERGASVFPPLFHTSRDFDFIIDWERGPERVQVKTSTVFRNGRWDVTVCTRGGNQSWNGVVKRLDPARYELLFVVVGDGRRWLIPADQVAGGSSVRLGGPKYAAWEIDRGRPLIEADSSLH